MNRYHLFNLVELDASDNKNITNVNHMTNLIKLYACEDSGIHDVGISQLNLLQLNASVTHQKFVIVLLL